MSTNGLPLSISDTASISSPWDVGGEESWCRWRAVESEFKSCLFLLVSPHSPPGNSSLPQNHRPKITLEKNTLGCKHRRVALKSPGLPRSGSSEPTAVGPLSGPGPTALPPPPPVLLISAHMASRPNLTSYQVSFQRSRQKFKAQLGGRHAWCLGENQEG